MDIYVIQLRTSIQLQRRGAVNLLNEAVDKCEQGLSVSNSVLDICQDSFLTADEKREKASMQFFKDTGLMALLC